MEEECLFRSKVFKTLYRRMILKQAKSWSTELLSGVLSSFELETENKLYVWIYVHLH